ncbi:hypothetical protein F543_22550 [Bibersteinia trehalosi USDA-ARS-USMARC-189]|uniref:Uncharacterized protein n=1 Tax=Bibersteinia trehalosi USDA-ARS-USMARC-189 TaxID=1263831 RepID=A0ABM5PFJ7_BIBTR|nr:hypothetical protein F543_22550 [Bibersteinia trehalosi USDA-ARS-USMARC-189]
MLIACILSIFYFVSIFETIIFKKRYFSHFLFHYNALIKSFGGQSCLPN